MIYKFSFSISGDDFYPEDIIGKIKGDFLIDSYFGPKEYKPDKSLEEYGYGNISFWHPKKLSTEENIAEYETQFINFLEKNHELFIEKGADSFEIFMEVYFDGGQCNFEIFDKHALKKMSMYEVSLPISIYVLPYQEIQNWENEIRREW